MAQSLPGLAPASARPETGTGAEAGIYVPPLAGPRSKISGTLNADTSGPSGFYVAVFDSHGDAKYYHGTTDPRGRYRFALPAAAAAFMVFRHFNATGKPDEGARCAVTSDAGAIIPGTRRATLPPEPRNAPQIVAGNSAYQRGTDMTFQTARGNGYDARVLVDGSPQYAETLAASDRSIVAHLQTDAPIGRHQLSIESGGKRSRTVPVDLIDATLSASGSHETGGVQTAILSVTGLLPGERAVANFEVTGSAELARGGNRTSVPVIDNRATVDVRGVRPGEAIIHWNLRLDIPPVWTEQIAEATPTPYPYYTTSRPSPEPTVKPSPMPTRRDHGHTSGRETNTPPPTMGRTPGPKTTSAPTPTPTEAPSEPPTPYPTPSTSPSPTPTPCSYEMDDGWFEPTQGVWQDDPFFPNMSGKELTRLHDLDPVPHFAAELDMVQGRDTVLFGVNHYMDRGRRVDINSRNTIVIALKTNCSQTKPARVAFTVKQRGGQRTIMTSSIFMIPIEGPRNADPAMKPFVVRLPAAPGLPATPFMLDEGGYDMEGELITNSGGHTGLMVVVSGDTVVTYAPTLHFVPMRLFYGSTPPGALPSGPGTLLGGLIATTEALRAESAELIPDYYPIAPFSLPTIRERYWNVSWDAIKNNDLWDATKFLTGYVLSGFDQDSADIFASLAVVERFTTGLANAQGFAAYMNGANRMIVVMSGLDYDRVMGSSAIASYNLGNKAVLIRAGVNADTVAHEVAHSIPPPNWNPDPECHFPYHNSGVTGVVPDPYGKGTTANGYAAGERLRLRGRRTRVLTDGTLHIMGGAVNVPTKRVYAYIEQCTYWHLKNEMLQPPDPAVILVRGVVARAGRRFAALLGPAYSLSGSADLKTGVRGAWHITLEDRNGALLADYAFDPQWNDENGRARNAFPFAYRIGDPGNAGAIVLSGEGKRLVLRLSPSAPSIRILSPGARGKVGESGSVRVRWQASVAQGYVPVSSIFVSEDGGKTYSAQLVESRANVATITVNPKKHRHRLKIVVSDYSRSSERILDFTT